MKLRNIEFGSVIGASGVQGFFGEGYSYHRLLRAFLGEKFDFRGMTFTAKTTTLNEQKGNMPRKADGMSPRELKPKCIVVKCRKGVALNAVGLSGPGAKFLLDLGRWQARTDNFIISFMSVKKTPQERLEELRAFVALLWPYIVSFRGKIALQINFSCPNVGVHLDELIEEVLAALEIAAFLGIPLIPKFNIMTDVRTVSRISQDVRCDAICISNTIPWGKLPERIDWKGLFGSDESPLKEFGGGGLSGAPLLPLVIEWLERARGEITKPMIVGGGILGPRDVERLSYAPLPPSSAISPGSITMLRPWRLAATIRRGRELFK